MDIAQLELEAALKYTEAEHSYSYATVSDALHVAEPTGHEAMPLHLLKYSPQHPPDFVLSQMCALDKVA
jgi:hypothetical protein